MASTRSKPYTATTRPRETAKEPSALAQIQQRGRRAPLQARAPRQVRAPPPARAPRERRVPPQARAPRQVRAPRERRVPPLVGQRVGQREPPALPLARAPRERRILRAPQVRALRERGVPQVRQQGRPPATIPPELAPEQRALRDQRPQAIAPRVGTP